MKPTRNPSGKKFRAGFAKREITPPLPFPMGGMADRRERLADRVRDPLYARALAVSDGCVTAVLVAADLLLFVTPLRDAVEQCLRSTGAKFDGLMLSATHTHSSTGGFWDTPSAPLYLGHYRQAIFDHLKENIAAAAAEAIADLRAADLSFGETATTYLNYNRRDKDGPIDRTLGVLTIKRRPDVIRAVFFGAHPVGVAFREYNTASADYPGELLKLLEAEGDKALFVVGPVGGVNVLFPEGPMAVDVHLALLARLMREEVTRAVAAQTPVPPGEVRFSRGDFSLSVVAPRLLPDRLDWLDGALLPLRLWVRRFGRRGICGEHAARVPVLRVGDLIFTGFPADLGAGIGLAVRRLVAERGLRTAVAASQTDDYVGYAHLPEQYQQLETKDKSAMWMGIYENAMAFGGRQVGAEMLAAFRRAFAEVAPPD